MNYSGKFDGKFDAKVSADALHSSGHLHTETIHAAHVPSDAIIVPDAHMLFGGEFKRSGVDLVLSDDGRELVLHDYFKGEKRAPLSSPDGAHLTGDLVTALAGQVQYAQADGAAGAHQVIGHVSKLVGTATAIRNGVSIILNNGDNVEKGDVVQSGSDSTLGVTFIDGTVFGLSSNARMVLNEMVYDPNGSNNSSLLSLVAGTITFVAGETAKHGDMKVDTPVATMGIRGTAVLFAVHFKLPNGAAVLDDLNPPSDAVPEGAFQVLTEPDGTTGSYILFDKQTLTPFRLVDVAGLQINISNNIVSQSLVPLSPEIQKLITDVFALKFSDSSNTKSLDHFTDSIVPNGFKTFALNFNTPPPSIPIISNLAVTSASGPQNSGSNGQHVPIPPSLDDISPGSITELNNTTGSAAPDKATIHFTYNDVNSGDQPTVSVNFASFTFQDAQGNIEKLSQLNQLQQVDIAAVEVITNAVQQGTLVNNKGTATWTYQVPDGAFDFLAANEKLTLTFNAIVDNNFAPNDQTGSKTFTITIDGSNDVPKITTAQQNFEFAAAGTGTQGGALPVLSNTATTGTLNFTDPDLTDTHTVSASLVSALLNGQGIENTSVGQDLFNELASALTATLTNATGSTDSTGSGSGTIQWTLASLKVFLADFIPDGESLVLTYAVTVTDSQKTSATQDVVFTIDGNNAPGSAWIDTTPLLTNGVALWSTAANWSNDLVPSKDSDVLIGTDQVLPGTPTFPVTVNADAFARSLTINDFADFVKAPELDVEAGVTLAISGALSLNTGTGPGIALNPESTIDNLGTITVGGIATLLKDSVLDNSGTLKLSQGGVFGDQSSITNSGIIELVGNTLNVETLNVEVDIANSGANSGGTIRVDTDATLELSNGATVTGGKVVFADSTAKLFVGGGGGTLDGVAVTGGGEIDVGSATATSVTLTLDDAASVTGGKLVFADSPDKVAIGAGGATLDGVVVSGGGEIDVGSATVTGVTLNLDDGATINGGTIDDAGTLSITGSSEIENATVNGGGDVTVTGGTLTLSKVTLDDVTLAGSFTNADTLTVGDTVTLNGATINGGNIVDNGTLSVTGSSEIENATVNGGGTLSAASGETLTLATVTLDDVTLSGNVSNVGTLTVNDTVTLDGATINGGNITDNGTITGTGAIGSVITGSGALTASGGTLTLSGDNTYSGATTIDSGAVLAAGAAGAFSANSADTVTGTLDLDGFNNTIGSLSGAGTVTNSSTTTAATLSTNALNDASTTFSGDITDSGTTGTLGLTKQGKGTLTLSGDNTYHGATNISAGTLAAGAAGAFSANSADTVTGTLDLDGFNNTIGSLSGAGTVTNSSTTTAATLSTNALNDASTTFSGDITDSGTTGTLGLTKQGKGTLTLSGDNTYHGATNISAGTLAAGSTDAFSANSADTVTGTLDLDGFNNTIGSLSGAGTVTNSSTTTAATLSTNALNDASTTFSGDITDSGTTGTLGLTKQGKGTLTLSGDNTYHGATNISAGTLAAGSTDAFSANSAVTDNGTLDLGTADQTIASLSGTNVAALVGSFSGSGTGPAVLTINNGGSFAGVIEDGSTSAATALTLAGGTETLTLTGINTYTGATDINGGTLKLSGTGSIADSSDVIDHGTFDISGLTNGGTSIKTLSGDGTVDLGTETLTLSNANSDTFSGAITGGGGLTLTAGTETLSGANTYTGATDINGGTLKLSGSGTIADSSGVADDGTFDISGLTNGGTSIKTLSGAGNVTLGGNTLTLTAAAGALSGAIGLATDTGGLTLTGTETLSGDNLYGGVTTINGSSTLKLTGTGSISDSSNVADGGTFDISGLTNGGTSIKTLSGAGNVTLGGNTLTLTAAAGTLSGAIGLATDTGGLTLTGTETLSGDNLYGGVTTINGSSTLKLTGTGSISDSSNVADGGTFDISGLTNGGTSIKTLSGAGNVTLGGNTLTLTAATGTLSGAIGLATDTGGLTLTGTETLSGDNLYGGVTTINGSSTLKLTGTGSISDSSNVADGGTFDISGLTNGGASIKTLSGAGNVTLGGNTLTLTAAAGTLSGAIGLATDTGGLTLTGTETLSGDNLYGGVTTINGSSTLKLTGTGSISDSSNVADGGTFDISGLTNGGTSIKTLSGAGNVTLGGNTLTLTAATGTLSGAIGLATDTGGLTLTGTETLSGDNLYGGVTTINGSSTLKLTGTGSISDSSNVADGGTFDISGLTNGGTSIKTLSGDGTVDLGTETLTLSNANSDTFSGAITGGGGLTLTAGTETLSGANTYTGATDINGGTLKLSGSGSISDSSGVADGGTFDISGTSGATIKTLSGDGTVDLGTETLTLSNANSDTFSGAITGGGGLTLTAGTETLTGINTYTGATDINGGTLKLSGTGSIADSSGVADDGTFDISGLTNGGTSIKTLSGDGTVDLGTETLTLSNANSDTFSGAITGGGGLTLTAGTETLSGANTYTGATDINGGTLKLSGSGTIADSSGVADDGTFDISGLTNGGTSIKTLSGAGNVTLGGNTLTLTAAAGALSGAIGLATDTGGLTLTGTETLSGDNLYGGVTTINGSSTLKLTGTGSISDSSNVADGGTFDISGLTNGGTSIKTLSGAGNVTLGGNTLTLTAAAGTLSGAIGLATDTGGLTLTGTETLSGDNLYGGVTTINGSSTLKLTGTGSISDSSNVADGGTFDISGLTNGGTSIKTLSGTGNVTLGGNTLTLTAGAGSFSGVISGNGALTVDGSGTTETLTGVNSYTGTTTIGSGETLALSVSGSISASSGVDDEGTFTIAGLTNGGTSITTLSGAGNVTLGANTLTLTAAAGTLSGAIGLATDTGGLTLTGTETLSGDNLYGGVTTINGSSTLKLTGTGSISDSSKVADGGTFDISGLTNGGTSIKTLSGAGNVTLGGNTLTLTAAAGTLSGAIGLATDTGGLTLTGTETLSGDNLYGGVTTINGSSTLKLTGTGSISDSSNVADGGTFDISGTSGATIKTLSGDGTVDLGTETLTLSNANSDTFSGAITGGGGLTLTAGTETLSGANTYTGATDINGGTLKLSGTGSIADSSDVIDHGTFDISGLTNGGTSIKTLSGDGTVDLGTETLTLSNANSDTFSGAITGGGGLTLTAGTETLSGANTYTGATDINGGTLKLSGSGTIADSSGVADDGTFDISGLTNGGTSIKTLSGAGNVTLGGNTLTLTAAAGALSGAIGLATDTGGLTLTGTETLSGANTYTGATDINGGTLKLSGSGTIADSSGVADDGTFDISGLTNGGTSIKTLSGAGNVTLGGNTLTLTAAAGTLSGAIGLATDTGGLTLTGTETLSGDNLYGGVTTINGSSTLKLTGTGSISDSSNVADGGTFDISGLTNGGTSIKTLSGAGNVTLGGNTLTLTAAAGALSGAIGLATDTGGLTLTGTETLSGDNLYGGVTTINGSSTLKLTGTGSISDSSNVADGGTFDISGLTNGGTSIKTLSGAGNVTLGGNTLTLTAAAGTLSGAIGLATDTGGLTLTGTETLSGDNLYGGVTTINGSSTLKLTGTGSISDSSNVADGGTFDISGLTNGGTSITTLSGAGNVTLGGNTLTLTAATGTLSGAIGLATDTGGLTLTGTETLSGANTYTGATDINGGTLKLSGSGTIADSSGVADDGTFDISGLTNGGTSIKTLSGAGNVTLGGNTLTLTAATGTLSGAIGLATDTGGLTLTGTETLSGDNLYGGVTTINGSSTLKLTGTGSISDSSNVADGGTFDISGLTNGGTSIKTLSGAGNVTLGGNTLTLTAAAGTLSGAIGLATDTGGLTLTGTETLSGDNLYGGVTTINGSSTLKLTGTGSISDSSNVADGGTFDISGLTNGGTSIKTLSGAGNVTLGGNTLTLTAATGTLSGAIGLATDTGGLTLTGTETLSGDNLYGGVTTINGSSTLKLTGTGSISDSSNVADGGTFDISGLTNGGTSIKTLSGTGNVTLGGNTLTLTAGAGSFSGVISGNGALTVDGSGTTETLTGVNSYTGTTTIGSGETLALSVSGSISASSGVDDEGTFTIAGLTNGGTSITTLSGAGNVTLGANTLTLTAAAGTLSGAIGLATDTGGLTLTGTETLSGDNLYGGVTTINGSSTLKLTGTGSISDSSKVADGGTFDISGLTNGGTSIKTLSGAGNVTLGANTLTLTAAAGTLSGAIGLATDTGGLTVAAGTETLNGGTINVGTLNVQGELDTTGTSFITDTTIINPGHIHQISGTLTIDPSPFNNAGGTFEVGGTTILSGEDVTNSVTVGNTTTNGTFLIDKTGTLTLDNSTINGGTIIDNGTLLLEGTSKLENVTFTGAATLDISSNATLEIGGSVSGVTVNFQDSSGHSGLILDNPYSFSGVINGLDESSDGIENHENYIDLVGFTDSSKHPASVLSAVYNSHGITVVTIVNGIDKPLTIDLEGNYSQRDIEFATDHNGGTLFSDPAADSGAVTIDSGTTLDIGGASSAAITFANSTGTTGDLVLADSKGFTGSITGFAGDGTVANSDLIDVRDVNFASVATNKTTYADHGNDTGALTLYNASGQALDSVNFNGNYQLANFTIEDDGNGGTLIVDPPVNGNSQAPTSTIVAGGPSQVSGASAPGDNFAFNFAGPSHGTGMDFHPADWSQLGHSTSANGQVAWNGTHDEGHGNMPMAADGHDSFTAAGILKAHLHADFHFV